MVKNPAANAGNIRHVGSIPGSGRSPGEGHNNPFQYSCLENPMDRGSFQATVHKIAQRRTRLKWLRTHARTIVKSSYHKIPNLSHRLFLLIIQGLCFAKVALFPGPHRVGKRTTWYLIPRAQTWPQLCAVLICPASLLRLLPSVLLMKWWVCVCPSYIIRQNSRGCPSRILWQQQNFHTMGEPFYSRKDHC